MEERVDGWVSKTDPLDCWISGFLQHCTPRRGTKLKLLASDSGEERDDARVTKPQGHLWLAALWVRYTTRLPHNIPEQDRIELLVNK